MNKTKLNLARAAQMLLLAVLTSFVAVSPSFAAAGNPTQGSCGPSDKPEAVLWEFNMTTQTLTISGEGDMADFESPADTPWYSWCNDITSVVVANGVTSVSDYAFSSDYWQLSSVTMASTVLSIGDYAFCNVPLTSIQKIKTENAVRKKEGAADEPVASFLPDNLQTIGQYAFCNTQITSLTIPAYVNSIGEGALSYNSYLTTLTCLGTMIVPWLDGDVLEGSPVTAIYVPDAAIDDYKNAECWQQYVSLLKPISEQADEPGDEPGGDVEEINGSEVVTVGNGGRASGYLPCYPNNAYSMSQQIYTSDEIGKAGLITSIAFYNYDTGSARECDIYLSHTTKTSFDGTTDWVTVSAENKVFSGTMNLESGWTVIDFDTPFQYNGTQNLLLTVDDNTGKDTGYNFGIGASDASSNQSLYYYKMFGTPVNLDPTQAITEGGTVYSRKNHIKLCFETYPKPYQLTATEVGDVSAQIQCSLRGEATAWNLRYRKVAKEGEEEQRYVAVSDLTTRSFTMEDLDPMTKYEVQVQAVFDEDNLSAWTDPLVFTTNCCPVEEQAEIIYSMNSNYSNYNGYAVQFIDITDENNHVEVAYVNPPGYGLYGGSLTLCCGHKYQVNWIYDEEHSNVNSNFSLALYFEPGDLFYSMARGEAPEKTAELTTFVMDCTPYCAQSPQALTDAGTTFNSATISFRSETKAGEVVYSTEEGFSPDDVTPTSMDFTALTVDPNGWDPNPANSSLTLTGLEPLTAYYVRVRSICEGGIGHSRWSDPIKVTTGSRYDGPTQVIAEPINSRSEKLTWGSQGTEKGYNLYYRKQAAGNPVDASAVQTFGGGKGTGFENGSWGDEIWSSYGDRPFSNTVFVANVPAGSSFGFKAGNGKSGAGKTKFLYGMKKLEAGKTAEETMKQFDKKCLNDADRMAIINALKDKKVDLEAQLAALALKLANGEITDDEYNKQKETLEGQINAYEAEIAELESLPTDAQKLEQMRTLEQKIKDNEAALVALALQNANDEITSEEYEKQKTTIEAQNALYGAELGELRAMTTNAENPEKDGFSITKEKESANARTRGTDDDTYIFFIRHADPNGVLLVKDLTITPPDQIGEWTIINNINKTEYMLTGLDPETTYEVMVEAVYESGLTGSRSPIATFTTIGAETDPSEGVFSVAGNKKVQFAKGNLRYQGDDWEGHWSMANQQYEVLGQENVQAQRESTYPADLKDLLCWSTAKNRYGINNYYYIEEEAEAASYFQGDFADWGSVPALISDLGSGWSTLSKDEWNYLLNERENAAQLKMTATVAGVKGLVLIPDEWTAPDGVLISEEMTADQWATIEQTGVVFLPVAGQLTSTYNTSTWETTTTVNEVGTYWTSTPSGDKSDLNAFALTIGDEGATLDTDLYRRVATAVRLVKEVLTAGDVDGDGKVTAADIVALVDVIAGLVTDPKALLAADLNNDGVVNIADIIILTKMIGTGNE